MAYFDNAATTFPKPSFVYSYMDEFYRACGGNVGRGNHKFSMGAGKLVAETRMKLQQVLRCQNKQIVFTPTATIALNIVIQGIITKRLNEGIKPVNVFITPFEHNAVTRILHHYEKNGLIKIHIIPVTDSLKYDLDLLQKLCDTTHPDVLIASHVSNVIGLIAPVKDLCVLAKKYNAHTIIDMAQSAGLVDFNVGLEAVDFAIFAGHKTLYGPTGISGFAMKPDIDIPAVIFGGTGFDSANEDMPNDIPQKFEMGTLNISGIAGLHASLEWLKETTVQDIWNKEQEHRSRLLEIFSNYEFIRVVGNYEGNSYVGIVSCLIDGLPSDTAANVFAEQNIAVRSGLQCAPLAHKKIGTYPSGTIRFSCGAFTNDDDFTELVNVLDMLKENL